jgi:O-antigen ligase
MKPLAAAAIIAAMYALHQDIWFWGEARPLVFGILPVGLFYHAAFTMVTPLALLGLVRLIWPSHLDPDGRSDE